MILEKKNSIRSVQDIIAELDEARSLGVSDYGYYHKMIHDIPDTEVINRELFILDKCMDKSVLDIGCNGTLHTKLSKVCRKLIGIDKDASGNNGTIKLNIEDQESFKTAIHDIKTGIDIVLCGEVLEHLSNPGLFLDALTAFDCPIIFTVPNAFCSQGDRMIRNLKENVNAEHVAWYSYNTFKTLVARYSYIITEFYWAGDEHHNNPGFTEGLVFVIKHGGM